MTTSVWSASITIDDAMVVLDEEHEEDILRLAGVGEESSLSDRVIETTRQRLPWLAVNLVTAILASLVIAQFEDTIAQLVALAVLMPIVASMGGNAGTQSLTVAVRALATQGPDRLERLAGDPPRGAGGAGQRAGLRGGDGRGRAGLVRLAGARAT